MNPSPVRVARFSPALLLAVFAACSTPASTDVTDVAVDAAMDVAPAEPGIVARFNLPANGMRPAPFEIPFPSDIYRDPDGTLADDLENFSVARIRQNTDAFSSAFRNMDGFGVNTGAMFLIDATGTDAAGNRVAIDPASLPADGPASLMPSASAFLIDLDPSATPATARIPCSAGWQGPFRIITVLPDRASLAPGRRYAAVLTTGIRATVAPYTLRATPTFAAIRDNAPGARAGSIGMLYGDAIDRAAMLAGSGFDRSRIAALSVFTTQTTPRQMRRARDAIIAGRAGPAPTLSTDTATAAPFSVVRFGATAHTGWTATLDEWLGTPLRRGGMDIPGFPSSTDPAGTGIAHDAIGAVLSGTYVSPDFRTMDAEIRFMADGTPIPVMANQRIAVTLILPRSPAPAAGYPVVIYGHGLGGQRREMLGLANEMARAGIAMAAIDWATFGQRSVPSEAASLEPGTYRGPDGFGDARSYATLDFFGNLVNLVAFRENIRQSALDVVQLRRVLANPALNLAFVADEYGGTAPRIDGTHVGYAGNSLGGIMGTVIGGMEPDINPLVLNVPGGAILTLLAPEVPGQAPLLATASNIIFGAPSDAVIDRYHPLCNLVQMIIDGADPASFARELARPAMGRGHDVWVVESVNDETVSNASTELLASLMGLPQIQPVTLTVPGLSAIMPPVMGNMPMGATAGFLQSIPSTHGSNLTSRYGEHRTAPPFPRATGTRFPTLARPYRVREWIVAYQRNIAAFLLSTFAGTPRIDITGMVPLADMDDDGWTDDEERTAMTDPYDPMSHPAGMPPHVRDVGF